MSVLGPAAQWLTAIARDAGLVNWFLFAAVTPMIVVAARHPRLGLFAAAGIPLFHGVMLRLWVEGLFMPWSNYGPLEAVEKIRIVEADCRGVLVTVQLGAGVPAAMWLVSMIPTAATARPILREVGWLPILLAGSPLAWCIGPAASGLRSVVATALAIALAGALLALAPPHRRRAAAVAYAGSVPLLLCCFHAAVAMTWFDPERVESIYSSLRLIPQMAGATWTNSVLLLIATMLAFVPAIQLRLRGAKWACAVAAGATLLLTFPGLGP